MNRRPERDRKAESEKYQNILTDLLKDDDNKYCADCDAKGPRWASWNLGVFLCIRCAGIHRNLGCHISKVKSVNLDSWTAEQTAMVQEIGNSRGRAVYEANLPDHFRRPQTDTSLEAFIRAKYEQKKYIAKEWIPPQNPKLKAPLDDDKNVKKTRTRNKQSVPPAVSMPSKESVASNSNKTKQPSQTTEKPINPVNRQSASADLLGLEDPSPSSSQQQQQQQHQSQNDNEFGDFMSTPAAKPSSSEPTSNEEALSDLFGGGKQQASLANDSKMSTKDIMALYGDTAASSLNQQMFVPNPNTSLAYNSGVPSQTQQFVTNQAMIPPQEDKENNEVNNTNEKNLMILEPQLHFVKEINEKSDVKNTSNNMMGQGMNMGMGMAYSAAPPTQQIQQQQHQQHQHQQQQQQQQFNMYQANMMQTAANGQNNMFAMQQQMQHQMANMNLNQQIPYQQPNFAAQQTYSGQTLSNNLWQ